jgi:hypothetical protein
MTDQPEKPRRFARELEYITALLHIGIDQARRPDRTGYWPRPTKPAPNPAKRAKVKAARKQRNRKP